MSWNEQLPEWNDTGTEPPQQKKDTGWQPEEKPPAGWFNWLFNRVYKVLQEIRSRIETAEGNIFSGSYNDLDEVPESFPPSAHKSTHATSGADELTPEDIGAETPSGSQAKATAAGAAALSAANDYTDQEVGTVADAVNALATAQASHEEETATIVIIKKDVSILSASWVDDTGTSGFWYYEINDTDVDADSVVDVNIQLADLEKAEDLKSVTQSFADKYRLYADAQPAENITADTRITNQIGGEA